MWSGDRRNFVTATEGVGIALDAFHSGLGSAMSTLSEYRQANLYERAIAAKAASDARHDELCHAWHLLADQHDRALARIDQLERLLAQRY